MTLTRERFIFEDMNIMLRRRLKGLYPDGAGARQVARRMCRGGAENLMNVHESIVLWAVARQYNFPGANFLEIGTYRGCSCAILAQAAPLAKIKTLEINEEFALSAQEDLANLTNVTVLNLSSADYLNSYSGQEFDLIFIDGDHRHVELDLPWWDYVAPGGVMLFHDYTVGLFDDLVAIVNSFMTRLGKTFDIYVMATDTNRGFVGVYK